MTSLTRYKYVKYDTGNGYIREGIEPHPQGEWVKFNDTVLLQQRLAEVEQERDIAHDTNKLYEQQLQARDSEIEMYKAEMGYHEAKDVIDQLTEHLEARDATIARLEKENWDLWQRMATQHALTPPTGGEQR